MAAKTQAKPETTDLERRVLAHEHILKSLIAYMSRTDPRFLDHLARTIVQPMGMERREHDFVDTDSHAEDFIRAVAALCAAPAKEKKEVPPRGPKTVDPVQTVDDAVLDRPPRDRVRVTLRNGIWTVWVDGAFAGDYSQPEFAETAAALARLAPSGV